MSLIGALIVGSLMYATNAEPIWLPDEFVRLKVPKAEIPSVKDSSEFDIKIIKEPGFKDQNWNLSQIPVANSPVSSITKIKSFEDDGFSKAAEILRAAIDESVDPCSDFYDFACGKYEQTTTIPEDQTGLGRFSELFDKVKSEMRSLFENPKLSSSAAINTAKQFYAVCMDVAELNKKGSSELLKKIEEFGYWPAVHDSRWHQNNLANLLKNVSKSREASIFFNAYVSEDEKNVSRRLLHFDQGDLGIGGGTRDYYLNETLYGNYIAAYRKYQIEIIKLLVNDAGTKRSNKQIEKEVDEVLAFETALAKIQVPEDERRNNSKLYNPMRLSEMNSLLSHLVSDWHAYFSWRAQSSVPNDSNLLELYLSTDPQVIVREPAYLKALNELVGATDLRVLTNYVFWRYATQWDSQLDERFDDIRQEYNKAMFGLRKKPKRWEACLKATYRIMGFAGGAMYVRTNFDKRSRTTAAEILVELRSAFKEMLKVIEWMDSATQKYALEKAEEILPHIAYPDFLLNDTKLDAYYETMALKPTDGIAVAAEKWAQWSQRKQFHSLIEQVDRSEFLSSPNIVNAYYIPELNAIEFPAAILQSPFFDQSFPKAVNFGGIGAVMGHEITHGFDDEGSQFDKIGNLREWWESSTQQRFEERKQCIIDQYSSFVMPGLDKKMHVNGVLTQGENIADNGGVKEAFRAYRTFIKKTLGGKEEKRLPGLERYTPNQIFFMAYAQVWCGKMRPEAAINRLLVDPHSPGRFRVNGVVMNQEAFAEAFSCPIGVTMNPDPKKRCSVW